ADIDKGYKWNIEDMYSDEAQWAEDCKKVEQEANAFVKFSGHLDDGGKTLLAALTTKDEIWLTLERVYVYARMRKDEDNRVSRYQSMADKASSLIAKTAAAMSFFTPELLEIPEEKLLAFFDKEKGLATYRFIIENTLREKAHILSKNEEMLMAQFSELVPATNTILYDQQRRY
ncbi:MAG: oligoendopeptidase F, partial [Anaerovorax sp.]